jgi:hypothetical protein
VNKYVTRIELAVVVVVVAGLAVWGARRLARAYHRMP